MENILPISEEEDTPISLVNDPASQIPDSPSHKIVKYKECLRNHAAAMGVNATDGCGEFMPPATAGAGPESLICSACSCHRNFHRKVEFDRNFSSYHPSGHYSRDIGRAVPRNYDYMGGDMVTSVADDQVEEHGGGGGKKRSRTKFSREQKERMLEFAERLGWKMQKTEESEVQRFCEEIGVNRRVFKVWMHNNKNHNVGKKKNADHH